MSPAALTRRTALLGALGAVAGAAQARAAGAGLPAPVALLQRLVLLESSLAAAYALVPPGARRAVRGFGAQERAHAAGLESALRALGGQPFPVPPPGADPRLAAIRAAGGDVAAFGKAVTLLEQVTITAQLDSAALLEDPRLVQVCAQIAANHAQHLVAWRALSGQQLVPKAFETGARGR